MAIPTVSAGIRFPSKIQALVFGELRAKGAPGSLVVREPRIDIPALAGPDGKPGTWRPDFLVTDGEEVSIHEAKGSRAAESRDFRLRAQAAANTYPWLPIYVWRYAGKGKIRRFTLAEALA